MAHSVHEKFPSRARFVLTSGYAFGMVRRHRAVRELARRSPDLRVLFVEQAAAFEALTSLELFAGSKLIATGTFLEGSSRPFVLDYPLSAVSRP